MARPNKYVRFIPNGWYIKSSYLISPQHTSSVAVCFPPVYRNCTVVNTLGEDGLGWYCGYLFQRQCFFASSRYGEASLLSDSPLSDTYVGTLAEKKPVNSPLAAGALLQDWKRQYFEISWKTSLSAAAALRGCAAVFCPPLCSSQGQLSPINVFSVLWGVAECGRTTANETKSCDFFWKGEGSCCQIACAVTFSLAADVQIKSFPDYRGGDCLWGKLIFRTPPVPSTFVSSLELGRALTGV